MALFLIEGNAYASHMPLYGFPHDVQILYRVELPWPMLQKVEQAQSSLVSLLPENFDLNLLFQGKRFAVPAVLYDGHFERGGTPVSESRTVTFVERIYLRELEPSAHQNTSSQYVAVNVQQGQSLFVHSIQSPPSFDHIVLADNRGCPSSQVGVSTISVVSRGVDSKQQMQLLRDKLPQCVTLSSLYWEVQDFK